ncbi:hypothetical protein [Bacillus sp. FJAT-49736]|uniref:hypothetical protein n=1 Tax=Bacillus sp. FJAT-49736 TaxID=2833582 RepID=UPI001BCA01F6|nr:hypothetical protein [Bacillus sp. FJAT-49736]MBS4172815.1 hypothetical protein [Bacillus sp. FJAT-49736]
MEKIKTKFKIEEEALRNWEAIAVPDVELFFFETIKQIQELMPLGTLIIPRHEFNNHRSYQAMDINNSYQLWGVSNSGNYVCVLPPVLFPTIGNEKKKAILKIQKKLNRGLIYPWTLVEEVLKELPLSKEDKTRNLMKPYIFDVDGETCVAFQKEMWCQAPQILRWKMLMKIAESYIDEIPEVEEAFLSPFLRKYSNRFPAINGPNCFAAALAAATEDVQASEWIINQWIHPDTFLLGLEMRGYKELECELDQLEPKDILVWKNQNAAFIHASFHLGKGLFFNKDGQTFFNRWQIISEADLYRSWGSKNLSVFRCN